MKQITETPNEHHWPRTKVESIECRKRDLIVRIADWTRQKDEPAYDVEVYIGGVYDFNESQTFTLHEWMEKGLDRADAKVNARQRAVAFAQEKIASLI